MMRMADIPKELLSPFKPEEWEKALYKKWEESGFFNPDNLPPTHNKPFSIVMPPPNANGHLHAGHALFITLEDIMTRYRRMRGFKALWIPGADHAGFETQIVYEKQLEKEGRSRFKMDPKDLYKEIMAFTLENKKNMEDDVRAMGASCDWSREKFTLDPEIVKKVQQTFKKMHDDGLVYRGPRIVNWCSKHATSLSDVETETKERKDNFYYLKYGPFTIATARPETKFGDKYVVMHPDDTRYSAYTHGQKIDLEWINGPITATVIKDDSVDMEFGTGVMTITPWHDAVDFAIAERHKLEKEQIIDMRGKLLGIAGEFKGMKIAEAREKIVEKLKSKGLVEKIDENYLHNVPVCYKCETPIEPQILPQWFVKMQPLAEKAIEAVESGKITFHPEQYKKIFLYWMKHTHDWNISRQIVWGIPIPAKICDSCGFGTPDLDDSLSKCAKCNSGLRADTDTFDTWFSSGQWTLLVLDFPEGGDFKTFYPTDIMETGSDLIFKWIPRMVIFGLYLAGEVPFKTVYLHGLVNDAKGKKMSKSKGNVINPKDLTDKFGTDALRMGLVVGNTPGTDLSLSEDKIKGYKHFGNKLWNIARFIIQYTDDASPHAQPTTEEPLPLVKEWRQIAADITKDIENFRFYLAAEKLYHYLWRRFADEILEESKKIFSESDTRLSADRKEELKIILMESLATLHPFMPFVTEAIWSLLPNMWKEGRGDMLIIADWPIKQE